MSDLIPPPIQKPEIIIPDSGPLIHLAQAGLLHLLHEAGGAVVVVDMVAQEVTRDLTKPGAAALDDWIRDGQAPGSNTPVRVEETETGRLFQIALRAEPSLKLRNGGETAIVEWLAETVAGTGRAVIVLYENGRVPGIIRNQAMDADIDVLTTRAFLQAMQARADATVSRPNQDEGYWTRVAATGETRTPGSSPTASGARSPDHAACRTLVAPGVSPLHHRHEMHALTRLLAGSLTILARHSPPMTASSATVRRGVEERLG